MMQKPLLLKLRGIRFACAYERTIANIELAFKSKQPGPSNPFVGHNQMGETHDNSQASKPAKTVKLPKLHLQKFSGCPSEFRIFGIVSTRQLTLTQTLTM